MFYNSNLVRALDLTTLALEICVALVLLWRRLYRDVPWFTAYIGYLIAFTYTMYRVYNSGNQWARFYGSWAGNAVTIILAFLVIKELIRNALLDYEAIRRLCLRVLVVIVCVTLVIAILTSAYGSKWGNSAFPYVFMRFVQVTQRSVRIVQLGLLLSLFALSSYFALSWRNHTFGIALGYGLYASVNLCATAVQSFLGPQGKGLYLPIAIIDALAYICTLLLWLTYLIRPDRGTTDKALIPADANAHLERWNEALKEFMKK